MLSLILWIHTEQDWDFFSANLKEPMVTDSPHPRQSVDLAPVPGASLLSGVSSPSDWLTLTGDQAQS